MDSLWGVIIFFCDMMQNDSAIPENVCPYKAPIEKKITTKTSPLIPSLLKGVIFFLFFNNVTG